MCLGVLLRLIGWFRMCAWVVMYFYLDSSVRVPKDLRVKDIKYDAGLEIYIQENLGHGTGKQSEGFLGFCSSFVALVSPTRPNLATQLRGRFEAGVRPVLSAGSPGNSGENSPWNTPPPVQPSSARRGWPSARALMSPLIPITQRAALLRQRRRRAHGNRLDHSLCRSTRVNSRL